MSAATSRPNREIAAVQVYFNFLGEADRLAAAAESRKRLAAGDVRILTVEVVQEGKAPELPWDDKLVLTVAHPAWYKAAGINAGAKRLIAEGYRHIAWLDADAYIEPGEWGSAAVDLLSKHPVIQLGERVTETGLIGRPEASPAIAQRYTGDEKADDFGYDGGGWAARADLFTRVGGLWPYSMVEGGNKVLLYPFMRHSMEKHPLVVATRGTDVGRNLEQYWSALSSWVGDGTLGYLRDYDLILLPHGSQEGRERVWAIRYAFYRHFSIERDVTMTPEGLPQVANPRLRAFLNLILRERSFPSADPI